MSSRWARGATSTSSVPATSTTERARPSTSWRTAVSGPIVSTPRRSVGMRYPALTSASGASGATAMRAVRFVADRLDELEARRAAAADLLDEHLDAADVAGGEHGGADPAVDLDAWASDGRPRASRRARRGPSPRR